MGPVEWFSVTLHLRHPVADPTEISTVLGMTPKIVHKVGERRRTPNGQLLEGFYAASYWGSPKLVGDWRNPTEALAIHVKALEDKREFIKQFIESGGSVAFSLGWSMPGPSGGERFDADLLRRLGELRVNLEVSVYEHGLAESEPT